MRLCGRSSFAAVTLSVLAVFRPPSVSLRAVSGTALAFLLVAPASALDPALGVLFRAVFTEALALVLVAPASVLSHALTAAFASTFAATGLSVALARTLAGLCL
jgi:hypothetical protein